MIWLKKGYLAFGLLFEVVLLLSTDTTRADNSVHILSKYKQLVTSTTLNWLPLAHYEPSKEIVIGGFEILQETEGGGHSHNNPEPKRRPLFVCRALHNGLWVVGSQKDGEKNCTVSLHRIIQSYGRYELLENMNNAARISWVQWDKYHQPPVGAVATEKMYVARHKVNTNHDGQDPHHHRYTHYIGTFNPHDKLGTITYVEDNGLEEIAESGEILVETEPIYYELNSVKLDWHKKRVIQRTPMTLGKTTIVNEGAGSANMAEAFAYSYNYSIYWGQGHAILKGLNTSIMLTNGTALPNIMWGTKEEKLNTDVYTVTVYLEPGTGVNVSLEANYTDMELPYTGKLVSHYEDGTTKARPIGGIRSEKTMFDVTPILGPIYFLNNFTVVPTTTVPPTTEPPTTTTTAPTTTTTTTIKEITKGMNNHRPIDSIDQDENMIIPIQKSDTTNMQRDDGGPQSLKDKGDTSQSSSTVSSILITESTLVLSLLHLFSIILLHRIT